MDAGERRDSHRRPDIRGIIDTVLNKIRKYFNKKNNIRIELYLYEF